MNRFVFALLAGVSSLAMAASANAADLIIEEPMMPGIVEAAGGDWEGVYLGVFGGYTWGTFSDETSEFDIEDDEINVDGFHLGVTAGANFYLTDGIVAGIVGDIAWSNQTGTEDYFDDEVIEATINWFGSVRGKLGFDAGSFMPYVTAGLGFANGSIAWEDEGDSQTHIGWTAGIGVDIAATEDMSINLEYRYADYGSKEYDIVDPTEVGLTDHIFSVGLNWKF